MTNIQELKREISAARKKLNKFERELNSSTIKEIRNYYNANKQDIYESFILGFPYLNKKELKESNYDKYSQSVPFGIFEYGFNLGFGNLTTNNCYFGCELRHISANLEATHLLCCNAISRHVGRPVTSREVDIYINGIYVCGIIPSWEFLLKVAGNCEIEYNQDVFENKCSLELARYAESLLLQ